MPNPLRAAMAGLGVVGERRFRVLRDHSDFDVVAIADKKFTGDDYIDDDIPTYQNFEDLASLDLDVLFVSLPNNDAPKATMMGLENGWHVFAEKPPGRSVEDIQDVLNMAQQKPNLKLKYGFNHRYHDSVREALRIIKSGEMGKIINMRGVYGKSEFIPWPRPSHEALKDAGTPYWRTNRKIAGGGILLDQGIHMVDLMRIFASDFVDVKSFVSNDYWQHDVEDNAYAIMRSADGVVAMLHSTATQWQHSFSLDIHLEEGALLLSGILSGSKSYGDERLTVIYREENVGGRPRETSTKYIRDHSWRDEINDFALDIMEDRDVALGSGEDALKTVELVFKIYQADDVWSEKFNL